MAQFLPQTMPGWMRSTERRLSRLERRRSALAGQVFAGSVAARRANGANVNIPHGVVTDFDAGPFEYNFGMSAGALPGSIAVPVDGVYMLSCGVRWQSGWTGIAIFRVTDDSGNNLVTESRSVTQGGGGSQHAMTLACNIELTAGQELHMRLYQNSGAAQPTNAAFGLPFLALAILRGSA